MNSNYGKSYFEKIGSDKGWNGISHNPFSVIDFSLLVMGKGDVETLSTEGREYGLDIISGRVTIQVDDVLFENCGGRTSVFEGKPTLIYAGCDSKVTITALDQVEIGVGSALSSTSIKPYIVSPQDCRSGKWGSYSTSRYFDYMLDATTPGERISFAEVTVSNGNWATYPPHKHEDNCPGEAFQEELYFYKVQPQRGFGFCAQFGGKMQEDYAFMISNNTIHKQPFGYHTVTAAPGYSICYLAVYAGHDKTHKVSAHPDHLWYASDFERTLNHLKRDFQGV